MIPIVPSQTAADAAALLCSTFNVSESDVAVVRAPYRICPLGAHVDHQFGKVAACAIDHSIYFAFVASGEGFVTLVSDEFDGRVRFHVNDRLAPSDDWGNYARGAVSVCLDGAQFRGFVGASVGGRSAAGLSSSAAIGIAYLVALAYANEIDHSRRDLVRWDESIERGFLGLKNGILDPAAIVLSEAGRLTEIDTRSGEHECHAGGDGFRYIAFHSGVSQALTPANYNLRVEQSHSAAQSLARLAGLQPTERLGDVPFAVYQAHGDALGPTEYKRATHFFTEVERVERAIAAWRASDPVELGRLMQESGMSSIHNYECGATPVKDLYEALNETNGVYGARFCGPGFRGCCVALIDGARLEEVVEHAGTAYAAKQPEAAKQSWVLECEIADGVELIT